MELETLNNEETGLRLPREAKHDLKGRLANGSFEEGIKTSWDFSRRELGPLKQRGSRGVIRSLGTKGILRNQDLLMRLEERISISRPGASHKYSER